MRGLSFVVLGSVLGLVGCAAPSVTSEHAQVAFVEPRGDGTATDALSAAPSVDPATPCRDCGSHEVVRSHDVAYADFPDRMARIAGASFALDVSEVTVDAYARCVAAGACTEIAFDSRCGSAQKDNGKHPVSCVSFTQARSYCTWARKRLPTDAEWSMAATGIDGERRAVGVTPDGVRELFGNVAEWTDSASASSFDPARGVVQARMAPDKRDPLLGFRCARDS